MSETAAAVPDQVGPRRPGVLLIAAVIAAPLGFMGVMMLVAAAADASFRGQGIALAVGLLGFTAWIVTMSMAARRPQWRIAGGAVTAIAGAPRELIVPLDDIARIEHRLELVSSPWLWDHRRGYALRLKDGRAIRLGADSDRRNAYGNLMTAPVVYPGAQQLAKAAGLTIVETGGVAGPIYGAEARAQQADWSGGGLSEDEIAEWNRRVRGQVLITNGLTFGAVALVTIAVLAAVFL
jgi:hypothetical protein